MSLWQTIQRGLFSVAAAALFSTSALAADAVLRAAPSGGNSSVGGQIEVTIGRD